MKPLPLFDYIKVLFGKDSDWERVSNYDKVRNSFMCNRFMGIKFPIQANLFNFLKTDPVGQAESWRLVSLKFNRVPSFIYTKVKKQEKLKEWQPNTEVVELYMKINEIGKREFDEALKFNANEIKTAINILEKQILTNGNR